MLTSAVLAARDGPVACAHVQSPASSPPRARRGFANSGRLYAMMWSPWASPRLRSCRRVGHERQGLVVSRLREPLDVQFRQIARPGQVDRDVFAGSVSVDPGRGCVSDPIKPF